MRRGDKPSLVGVIRELEDALAHTEEDLSYAKAVLNGSWPTAVEQLEKALVKARTYKANT